MRPFEIVVMCTGNRVRSPIAEAVIREATHGVPVAVRSAGMLDLGRVEPLPEAVEAAAALGVDLVPHRTAWVGGEDLGAADLVLGFERKHVAAAVVDHNARRERTFTLPELVELLRRLPPADRAEPSARAGMLVAEAHELRRGSSGMPPEIADPLGGSGADYATAARRTVELAQELSERLFGVAGAGVDARPGSV